MVSQDEQNNAFLRKSEVQQQVMSPLNRPKNSASIYRNIFFMILIILFIIGGVALVGKFRQKSRDKDATKNEYQNAIEDEHRNADVDDGIEESYDNMFESDLSKNDIANANNISVALRSGSYYSKAKRPSSLGHMNIYVRKPDHSDVQNRYKAIRFPVARYNRRSFPLNGPFINFGPGLSLFVDKLTKQTVAYSGAGVYVLPSLINSFGKIFSVAELIASGYASLVSSGAVPTGSINMMSYFRPVPIMGVGIPTIDPMTGSFIDGVRTEYGSFPISNYDDTDSTSETEESDEETYSYGQGNFYKYRSPRRTTKKSTTHKPITDDDVPEAQWKECTDPFLKRIEAECAFVTVPLDHSKPRGTKIQIAISRVKHKSSHDDYQGVMMINPEGPGASGLSFASFGSLVPDGVGDFYDWIGFDTRGVGSSIPSFSCDKNYSKGPRPSYIPVDQNQEDKWLQRSKSYATACAADSHKLYEHMTTVDIVKDLEYIRIALRQKSINYYGYSYGTYMGQVYATLYPDRVRRMILDSNVDPRRVWFEANLDQNIGFDRNINKWFQWLATYNSVFNLGNSASDVKSTWDKVVNDLETTPINSVVGPSEWNDIFLITTYTQAAWVLFGTMFSKWVNEQNFDLIMEWYQIIETPGDDNLYAIYVAVICTDALWPQSWEYVRLANWRTYSKAPIFTWANAWFNSPCQYWPVKGGVPFTVNGVKSPEILLLSETLDAATPFEGSLEVRRRFPKARLISVPDGVTHANGLGDNDCINKQIAKYLRSGELPPRKDEDASDMECPLPITSQAVSRELTNSRKYINDILRRPVILRHQVKRHSLEDAKLE